MAEYVAWYIYTLRHLHTDSVMARVALGNVCKGQLCSDDKKRDLWPCDQDTIRVLMEKKEELQLQFRIYRQKGKHGQIEHWSHGNFENSFARRQSVTQRTALLEREAEEIYA